VLANLNPSLLETAVYSAARELRGRQATGEKSARCLAAARRVLSTVNPSDATVIENGKEVELSRQQATWIVRSVAKSMQTRTKEVGFDKANLEHVLPESPGSEWPNRKELAPYLWRLGNLTYYRGQYSFYISQLAA